MDGFFLAATMICLYSIVTNLDLITIFVQSTDDDRIMFIARTQSDISELQCFQLGRIGDQSPFSSGQV